MQKQKIILDYAYYTDQCLYKDSNISIYKGHHLQTNDITLVKIVETKKFKPQQLTQYINTLKSFKAFDHENIAKIMNIANTQNSIFIMYEDFEVSLQQVLTNGKVTEQEAIQLLEQITSALSYLNNKNIPHRNINCSNIMIKPNKNGGLKVKISNPNQNQQINKSIDLFMSPQFVSKKQNSVKGDIWGLGVVFLKLLNGQQYLKTLSYEQFAKYVSNSTSYKSMNISNWSKNLLIRMLVTQNEKRADISQIIQMIKGRKQNSLINFQPPVVLKQNQSQAQNQPQQIVARPSIPLAPSRHTQHQSVSPYHRSPLKYINKSPIRRNQSIQNPKSQRHIPFEVPQIKSKISHLLQLSQIVQKMLYMFNQAKIIYQQAVRITLLTLKHYIEIIEQIKKISQSSKHYFNQQQLRYIKHCQQKIQHYKQNNEKKMQHDVYFTRLLEKQVDTDFLTYIQFWLRLAIRHTKDFLEINRNNIIESGYLEGIFWSYIHALKYYSLLSWLKNQKRGNKIPQNICDRFFLQRPIITVDTFKVLEEQAMKALRL